MILSGNNETTTGGAADECSLEGSIYAMASPYLFPFVLEYSLISVATLLAMFFILNMPISTQTFEAIRQLLHHTTSSNNNQKNSGRLRWFTLAEQEISHFRDCLYSTQYITIYCFAKSLNEIIVCACSHLYDSVHTE